MAAGDDAPRGCLSTAGTVGYIRSNRAVQKLRHILFATTRGPESLRPLKTTRLPERKIARRNRAVQKPHHSFSAESFSLYEVTLRKMTPQYPAEITLPSGQL